MSGTLSSGIRPKALGVVVFMLFALFFLTSAGAFTYLREPIPEGAEVPSVTAVKQGRSVCVVAYLSRTLVFTVTPEAVVAAGVLGVLFSFNVEKLLRLKRRGDIPKSSLAALVAGVALASFSSSACWLACCNGGLLTAILTNALPSKTVNSIAAYSGLMAIPAASLLLVNLVKIKDG